MKKFLTILTVALLACSTVFAAVNFSGELKAGYTFVNNDNEWTSHVMGQDGIDSNSTKLNLSIGDEAGIWNIGLEGVVNLDARLMGDITVDVLKAFGLETDWDFSVALIANDRVQGLRAYSNKSGLSLDRIRSNEPGLWTSLTVGYSDLVSVQVAGGPKLTSADVDGSNNVAGVAAGQNVGDFIVSALVTPIDGLAVSAGYVYNGENTVMSKLADMAGAKIQGNGAFNAEVEANLADMLGLNFDLGLGVAEKYLLSPDGLPVDINSNVFLAQVYGGIDLISLTAEYGLATIMPKESDAINVSMFYVGADINVIEDLTLNVYTGATGLTSTEGLKELFSYDKTFYVGGNVGYTLAGVGLNLNVQYAGENAAKFLAGLGDIAQGGVGAAGFSITPSVSVSF